jgi:hypothetical protein
VKESYFLDKKGLDFLFDFHAGTLKMRHSNSIGLLLIYAVFFGVNGVADYFFSGVWWVFLVDFGVSLTCYITWSCLRKPLEVFRKVSYAARDEMLYDARVRAEIDVLEDSVNRDNLL